MKFTGARCARCNEVFNENDDIVVCPECGSPHHRKCWEEEGRCANTDKHGEDFSWTLPEELKPKTVPKLNSNPDEFENFRFKNGENAVKCPHCGAVNYGNDRFCLKCRQPLRQGENEIHDENFTEYQDNLKRFGGLAPDASVDGIPVEEYSAYIGGANPGRIIRRIASMERYGKSVSVSLAAFFLGPIWFFYRKMFREGLLYTVLIGLCMMISSFLFTSAAPAKNYYVAIYDAYVDFVQGEATQAEFADRVAEAEEKLGSSVFVNKDRTLQLVSSVFDYGVIAIRVLFSIFAFNLYRKKIKTNILKIREQCSDFPSYMNRLASVGGTSGAGIVLGIGTVILIQLLSLLPVIILISA